jgi:hypothetical protein
MKANMIKRLSGLPWLLLVGALMCNMGCQAHRKAQPEPTRSLKLNKVAGLCFLSMASLNEQPGVLRNPLSGGLVSAEPVEPQIIERMSGLLEDQIAEEKVFELIPRNQAIGVYSKILSSDEGVDMPEIQVIRRVGTTFDADAVLVGYFYRWRERVGNDYGVSTPASVAFELNLVRSSDGVIVWKSKFDKTQQSLSENLLDMGTFIEGGGKWMTAESLAMVGLRKMIKEVKTSMQQ